MPFRLRPVPRVVAAACTLASSSLAAPSISTVSGAAQHGSSVTITGDGFGTKTTAEPLKWDDFEDGALGNDVSTTGYWENHGNGDIKFSDEHLRHPFSKRSVTDKMTYTWPSTTPNGNFYHLKAWPNAGRKYLTGYLYIEFPKLSTSGDWQAKLIHVLSGPEHADWPVLALQSWWTEGGDVGNNGNYFEFQYTGGAWPSSWNDWARAGEWLRFEVEWKDSTSASASDGMARFSAYHPGESVVSVTKSGTTMGSDGVTLSTPHFGYLLVNEGAGHQVDTTWDDIYMDDTWARVELCDGATWESRTDCEIQPPTAWTPSSITVTLNQGALSEGQTAYVYVVDAAGSANGTLVSLPASLASSTCRECSARALMFSRTRSRIFASMVGLINSNRPTRTRTAFSGAGSIVNGSSRSTSGRGTK